MEPGGRCSFLNEREIRQNIMTEDRESANQDSPADDPSPEETPFGAESARQADSSAGDPHPFDRPGRGDAQFQGPNFSSAEGEGRNPFAQDAGSASGGRSGDPFGASGDSSGLGGISSVSDVLAMASMGRIPLEMAKDWVRRNQTTSMIGAFAVGVFIGAISRD